MELEFWRRLAESSPVIVVAMGTAIFFLWRSLNDKDKRMDVKDQMLLNLQRETLVALSSVTTAVSDLKEAIQRRQ